jgi:hypothetical protein
MRARRAPVLLLLAPGLSLTDLDDPGFPNLGRLAQRSCIGLMNVTMAAWRTDLASACLTLGAGIRTAAPSGFAPALDGIRLNANALDRLRAGAKPRRAWGSLGASLDGSGTRTGLVVASSQTTRPIGAELLLAVMNRSGAVAEAADATALVRRAHDRPYGVAADLTGVAAAARRLLARCDLVAVDAGDLERARQYAPLCLPARAAAHRLGAMQDLDRLLGEVVPEALRRDGTLFLLSPVAADAHPFGVALVAGPHWPAGLLTSPATRTPGLVTNTDLLPTLADGSGPRGRGYRSVPGELDDLQRLATATLRVEAIRPLAWGILRGALLLVALLAAIPRSRPIARRLLPVPYVVPGLLLLAGDLIVPPPGPAALVHAVTGILILLALLLPRRDESVSLRLALLTGAITALILGDLATDARLLRGSPLGYSLSLGARYYGIGNEAAGLLLGSALLLPFALAGSSRRASRAAAAAGLVLYGVVAFALGSPSLGADFGTALAAVAAAALALPRLFRRRISAWHVAYALIASLLGAVLLALWDAGRAPELQTHLGRLVAEMQTRGITPLVTALVGKASTGLRVATGLWGVLVVLQTGIGLALLRHAPRTTTLSDGVSLLVPTAVALILFNDSGVIAAALALAPLPLLAATLCQTPRFGEGVSGKG